MPDIHCVEVVCPGLKNEAYPIDKMSRNLLRMFHDQIRIHLADWKPGDKEVRWGTGFASGETVDDVCVTMQLWIGPHPKLGLSPALKEGDALPFKSKQEGHPAKAEPLE